MFSLKRFFPLLKRDLAMNRKAIVYVFIVTVALSTITMVADTLFAVMPREMFINDVFSNFYRFFLLLSVVWASIIPFRNYDKKYNRSCEILLPSSIEEKFIANFVITFIILPILIFCALFIGMEIGHLINSIRFEGYNLLYKQTLCEFSHYGGWLWVYFLMGLGFLGAICFKKNKVIKTWAIVFGVAFIGILLFSLHVYLYHPDLKQYANFFGKTVQTAVKIIIHILFFACILGAYFKLKKERS